MRTMRPYMILAVLLALLATRATLADRILQPGESVVVDVDGQRTTFTAAPPIGPPPPPPPPPEEPPPSTDPTEPVPYPAIFPYTAPPGADLSKLPNDATLTTGVYVTSGDVSKRVVEKPGEVAVLKLSANQTPQFGPVFAGVDVVGGGLPDNDDVSKAGPKAGALVHSCTFSQSEGFGILAKGTCRITQSKVFDNKSGGIGGTGTSLDVLIDNCEIYRNNLKYKRTNSNKFTRGKVVMRDCYYHDNAGGVWADNYVKLLQVIRCRFERQVKDKSGDRWSAFDVRAEISDQLHVKDCSFTNDITAPLSIDEMLKGTVIEGNRFAGKSGMAAELRNMARDGYKLQGVVFRNNVFERNDLNIIPSGGNVSQSGNGIVVESNNVWPDGKVAEHVKVK